MKLSCMWHKSQRFMNEFVNLNWPIDLYDSFVLPILCEKPLNLSSEVDITQIMAKYSDVVHISFTSLPISVDEWKHLKEQTSKPPTQWISISPKCIRLAAEMATTVDLLDKIDLILTATHILGGNDIRSPRNHTIHSTINRHLKKIANEKLSK